MFEAVFGTETNLPNLEQLWYARRLLKGILQEDLKYFTWQLCKWLRMIGPQNLLPFRELIPNRCIHGESPLCRRFDRHARLAPTFLQSPYQCLLPPLIDHYFSRSPTHGFLPQPLWWVIWAFEGPWACGVSRHSNGLCKLTARSRKKCPPIKKSWQEPLFLQSLILHDFGPGKNKTTFLH